MSTKRKHKVALVYPQSKGSLSGCNPPYALMLLATALLNSGVDAKIFDVDAYRNNIPLMLKDVTFYAPDITAMPMFFSSYSCVDEVVRLLQDSRTGGTIILGGPEVTADPENVFRNFPTVRYLLAGEAERSLPQFVIACLEGGAVQDVPGLAYRDGEKIHINPFEIIEDLDNIPFPDRTLLLNNYRNSVYWRLGMKGPTDIIVSSRGCPFSCNFCFKLVRKARIRSADSVHKEIEHILSLGIKNIHFMDDLLVSSYKRVKEIFDPIDKNAGLRFKVRARANTITDEIAEYLSEHNVSEISCGYESGSDRILKLMNKECTVEKNRQAIASIKKYGITAIADIFFFYPGEDRASVNETFRFIEETKPSYVNWGFFFPLTSSPVFEDLKRKGILEGRWGINERPKVTYDYLSKEEFDGIVRDIVSFLKKYNRSLDVILPNLKHVLSNIDMVQLKVLMREFFRMDKLTLLSGDGK